MFLSVCIAASCLLLASAAPQNCASTDGFSCNRNNPCAPGLCHAGKTTYPGVTSRRYVTCEGADNSECNVRVCPKDTQWNDMTERCEIDGVEARCAFHTYHCDYAHRNPCYPYKCFRYSDYYLGTSRNKYITCEEDNSCTTSYCPRGEWWDPLFSECKPKSEMEGCQDTFTHYPNSLLGNNGQFLFSNDTLEGCEAFCLSKDLCVGYNYFTVLEGLGPTCYLSLGYSWDYQPGMPEGYDSYVRDGCAPSLERYYFNI